MRARIKALAGAFVFLACLVSAPAALGSDVSAIGYVDEAAIGRLPAFENAQRQYNAYRQSLEQSFEAQMKAAKTQADQQSVQQDFQQKIAQRQQELFGPLFARAQTAIAAVAANRALGVVVDKRIVLYGGLDITKDVLDLVSGPGAPVAPVNTPPPSSVGFIDQSALDQTPRIKAAQDRFVAFRQQQEAKLQSALAKAKTDAERRNLLKDSYSALDLEQRQILGPVISETENVISAVAKKRGLLLVIDQASRVYGGTDVTQDVVSALK
ncbi:MAG TPA: OmpH family outer membrane protein [Candidatus Dormibacteraeota bacterium]|nr:OmpH family outer membrane protein [Candidatus Dormibacteraeota bacterium]